MRNKIPNKSEKRPRKRQYSDNENHWWLLATLFAAMLMGLIMVSCQNEMPDATNVIEEGLPATIRLEVMPDATAKAQTRTEESAIKDLHVLVYNSQGELMGKTYNASTAAATTTVSTRSGSGYTLYAIANTGNAKLFDGTVAATETKLKAMKTGALATWDAIAGASHLVMVGSKTGITVVAGENTLTGKINITRIAAKVTLNIGVKAGSGIIIKDYQVFSLPEQSYYVPNTNNDGATAWKNGTSINVNAASVAKSFFMYENRRGKVDSISHQRYKAEKAAPQNATYVLINGETNTYKATWRVYLGENNTKDFNIKRNSTYTYNITLSRPEAEGADTRVEVENVPANCYIVASGGTVTIPVERANESFLPIGTSRMVNGKCIQLEETTDWKAELVWESSKGLVSLSNSTGKGATGGFKVTATNASTQGNAVVAIRNASNEILWSWHIWVTNYDGKATFATNNGKRNFVFMDRNLGATSNTPGREIACGLLYQWGRKDPFPGIGESGGSWYTTDNSDPIRVYNKTGVTYEITKQPVPNVTPNNLTNATRKPDTFYYYVNSPYDWFVYNNSSSQNNNLWGGGDASQTTATSKSVFDPCPPGWRIAPWLNNISPFAGMANSGSWTNSGFTWGNENAHFPAAGHRNSISGKFIYVNKYGSYWSGTPCSTDAYYLNFNHLNISSAFPTNYASRSCGFPVRCCQDNL